MQVTIWSAIKPFFSCNRLTRLTPRSSNIKMFISFQCPHASSSSSSISSSSSCYIKNSLLGKHSYLATWKLFFLVKGYLRKVSWSNYIFASCNVSKPPLPDPKLPHAQKELFARCHYKPIKGNTLVSRHDFDRRVKLQAECRNQALLFQEHTGWI